MIHSYRSDRASSSSLLMILMKMQVQSAQSSMARTVESFVLIYAISPEDDVPNMSIGLDQGLSGFSSLRVCYSQRVYVVLKKLRKEEEERKKYFLEMVLRLIAQGFIGPCYWNFNKQIDRPWGSRGFNIPCKMNIAASYINLMILYYEIFKTNKQQQMTTKIDKQHI